MCRGAISPLSLNTNAQIARNSVVECVFQKTVRVFTNVSNPLGTRPLLFVCLLWCINIELTNSGLSSYITNYKYNHVSPRMEYKKSTAKVKTRSSSGRLRGGKETEIRLHSCHCYVTTEVTRTIDSALSLNFINRCLSFVFFCVIFNDKIGDQEQLFLIIFQVILCFVD